MRNRPMAFCFLMFFFGISMILYGAGWLGLLPALFSFFFPIQQNTKYMRGKTFLLFYGLFCLGAFQTLQTLAPLTYVESLAEGEAIEVQGELYKKEVQGDAIRYYLRDTTWQGQNLGSCIYYAPLDEAAIGAKIQVQGVLAHIPQLRNEGSFDTKSYYYSQNIYYQIDQVTEITVLNAGSLLRNFLFELQQNIAAVDMQALPGEEGGLLAAITIGDRSGMEESVKNLFANVGISHIVAVSGLHVSVVGLGLFHFLRKRHGIYYSGIWAATVVVLYGITCGNSVSTVRAVGMFLMMLAALSIGKEYDALSAMFCMGIVLLFHNPLYLWNISFQMSFYIVFGVIYVAAPLGNAYFLHCRLGWERNHKKSKGRSWRPSRGQRLVQSVVVSSMIQIWSLPIVLWYFYGIPLYSMLLNLVLLPLVGVLLGLGLVAGLVGVLIPMRVTTLSLVFLPCHGILYFYEWLSAQVSQLPFCNVIVGRPEIWIFVLYDGGLLLGMHYITYVAKVRRIKSSARENRLGRSYRPIHPRVKYCVIGTCIWLECMPLLYGLQKLWNADPFEVVMLDVGQGDGIYIHSSNGEDYMIDGGSTSETEVGNRTLLPFLKSRGISKIDYWFVTHGDTDHISGLLEAIAAGYPIKYLVFAEYVLQNENVDAILDALEETGATTQILYVGQGETYLEGVGWATGPSFDEMEGMEQEKSRLKWEVLYAGDPANQEDANGNSLVLYLTYADFEGVFTGDIGAEQEMECLAYAAERNVGTVDLLKVAHHGSNYSNSEVWCQYLQPTISLCSVGADNSYGHPGEEAVARLENSDTVLFYTMYSGEIAITLSEGEQDRIIVREMVR